MLFDVLIRLLATIELTILFNAEGITTTSVVMSICAFLLMELSLLQNNRTLSYLALFLPFSIGYIWIFLYSDNHIIARIPMLANTSKSTQIILLTIFLIHTFLSTIIYDKLLFYKQNLHQTRDDSRELEDMLRNRNQRLLEKQDEEINMATLRERNRIAREIHDNVGHMLSRAILLLGAINTVNQDQNIKPQLDMLACTLDESMQKMRESVHDLHDDSIDLGKNFNDIIAELDSHFHIETSLDMDEALPKNVKLSLIGILKEALTNIIKHSNGDSVTIILRENRSFCTLSITDNGTVNSAKKQKLAIDDFDGIGLNNIRERAHSCGGDAYFYTNNGFTVFARLPYHEVSREH